MTGVLKQAGAIARGPLSVLSMYVEMPRRRRALGGVACGLLLSAATAGSGDYAEASEKRRAATASRSSHRKNLGRVVPKSAGYKIAQAALPAKAVDQGRRVETETTPSSGPASAAGDSSTVRVEATKSWREKMSEKFGMNYFLFLDGPGLTAETSDITPTVLGAPSDDGVRMFNLISFKWKFAKQIGLDLQTRTSVTFNRADEIRNPRDQFRWESPRLGVSGTLLKGEDWSLSGAVNSDLPYSFPQPIGGGDTAKQRKILWTPGMFANFSYRPAESKWSLFALLTPRFFIYEDPNAAEPTLADPTVSGGLTGQHKPEFILSLTPTVNYQLSEKSGLRLGTTLDYRKLVLSDWNPANASLSTRDQSPAWRLWATPLTFGYTHDFSRMLSVYAFVQTFPIEEQRRRRNGSVARLEEVTSVGMWLSGTIF